MPANFKIGPPKGKKRKATGDIEMRSTRERVASKDDEGDGGPTSQAPKRPSLRNRVLPPRPIPWAEPGYDRGSDDEPAKT